MTDAAPLSGNTTVVDIRDRMWRTCEGRATIVLNMWKAIESDDDFRGRTSRFTETSQRGNATSRLPGPLPADRPHRHRQPEAYHRKQITEARADRDIYRLRYVVDQAEHDLMRYVGMDREFDQDDPYWAKLVGDCTGDSPESLEVRLGCPAVFVRQTRRLNLQDVTTGEPATYSGVDLKVIEMRADGDSGRDIAKTLGIPKSTVYDFLNGDRETVRRTK